LVFGEPEFARRYVGGWASYMPARGCDRSDYLVLSLSTEMQIRHGRLCLGLPEQYSFRTIEDSLLLGKNGHVCLMLIHPLIVDT
jgi:hypothetical protein